MFLNYDILNEGKIAVNRSENKKPGFSEGKNPKPFLPGQKFPGSKALKSQSCGNSNWQKLR